MVQTNDRKTTTTFETGVKELEDVMAQLNKAKDGKYDYTVSAILEDGAATTVIVKDANDETGNSGNVKPPVKADYKFDTLTAYVGTNGAVEFSDATCSAISGWNLGNAKIEYTVSVDGGAERTFTQTLTGETAMSALAGQMTIPGLSVKNGTNITIDVLVTFNGTGSDASSVYTIAGTCYIF